MTIPKQTRPLLLTTCLLLSGCSFWPSGGAPVKKYTLSYTQAKPDVNDLKDTHLLVDTPSVYGPLDTLRIAIRPSVRTIDFMADGEWANRLGMLVQESLVYSLQNTNILGSVSRPSEGTRVDKALKLEIRGFEIDQFSRPPGRLAHVDYLAQIVEMPSRRVIASETFLENLTIDVESQENYISTLNQAHMNATQRIVDWTLKSLQGKEGKSTGKE